MVAQPRSPLPGGAPPGLDFWTPPLRNPFQEQPGPPRLRVLPPPPSIKSGPPPPVATMSRWGICLGRLGCKKGGSFPESAFSPASDFLTSVHKSTHPHKIRNDLEKKLKTIIICLVSIPTTYTYTPPTTPPRPRSGPPQALFLPSPTPSPVPP